MKEMVRERIQAALTALGTVEGVDLSGADFSVDYTKTPLHGDMASNVALQLAKPLGRAPRSIAEHLVSMLAADPMIEKVEIKGPGFINFFIVDRYYQQQLVQQLAVQDIPMPAVGQGQSVLLEFVSANPTGPLHVGHGRGAAYGSMLANLYRAVGYNVVTEYYVNDAGRQMHILSFSVWLRYVARCGATVHFPEKVYQGDYIQTIAAELHAIHQDQWFAPYAVQYQPALFALESEAEDYEGRLDAAIATYQALVGPEIAAGIADYTLQAILSGIQTDLEAFRVPFDQWYSERRLYSEGVIAQVFDQLLSQEALYEQDGAYWFAATRWGDEKDRVFKRSNGEYTYFAADLAYHWEKFQRGFDRMVDIFGADHHGYIPRLEAGMKALSLDTSRFDVQLVQFANLMRDGEKVSMSTRSGEFVTLAALCDEVGVDVARYFYAMVKAQQHMDFDLVVATKQSMDNPVYYVQYANARITRIFEKYQSQGGHGDAVLAGAHVDRLTEEAELALLRYIAQYPEMVAQAATQQAPHKVTAYLQELASRFHSYYNAVSCITDDVALSQARLALLAGIKQVIRSGLALLEVAAPESM
jgi:arginyl-tRNA synthetase